ncbi:MAG: hypothetical protein ACE5PM_06845, partial [Candidatus Hydrothermarchaeales archaeon]
MKRVKLEDWEKKGDLPKEMKGRFRELRKASVKRRPKSSEDIINTILYIKAKKEQEIRNGIIEILGKNKIRLNLNLEEKPIEKKSLFGTMQKADTEDLR